MPQRSGLELPRARTADSDLLYDRFGQRLFSYNLSTHQVEERSDKNNYFQYEFNTPSTVYTTGSSITNGFKIINVHSRAIKTLKTVKPNQGVFPLAADGDLMFFTLATYHDGKELHRNVVPLIGGHELVSYSAAAGLIDSGAILDGILHYSIFDERSKSYSLWKVDAGNSKSKPTFEKGGLTSGRLYVHAGRLFTSSKTEIFSGKDKYKCSDLCYFFDHQHILIRIYVGSNSDLKLDVLDTRTRRVIGGSGGVIDFRVSDKKVTVYEDGKMASIAVPR